MDRDDELKAIADAAHEEIGVLFSVLASNLVAPGMAEGEASDRFERGLQVVRRAVELARNAVHMT